MNHALLRAENFSAGWGAEAACLPVSFALGAGEILALTGGNGAGKSTLLHACAGGAKVFSGVCERSANTRLNFLPQRMSRVQGLPLSGRDWLGLTGAAENAPAALQPLLPRRLDQLSGGQLQALWLWASLGAPGEILLLDEPDNHLDDSMLTFLREILQERLRQGAAILLASHDAAFVQSLSARSLKVQSARCSPQTP